MADESSKPRQNPTPPGDAPTKRRSLRELVLGKPKNPLDPKVFHSLSLIAFFAWVGLGADGLSSSAYGPEEAFLALGEHQHFALYLALATAITVGVISIGYIQIIKLFPNGGGGYVVSSKLLGQKAGVVSGSALVIDYVLTISISVASGVDALMSFLPPEVLAYKLHVACILVIVLSWMNLRGVKESVTVLFPIFVLFVLTHLAVLGFGVIGRAGQLGPVVSTTIDETRNAIESGTVMVVLGLLIRAYCIGSGTYTGIEAVATAAGVLRDPRERTGRNTMIAMAVSLALTASGLIVCYLLYNVMHEPGRTLNATLIEAVAGHWEIAGIPIGKPFLITTLVAEGALLFVASQSGFMAGPRVLAVMAVDGWVPRLFSNLSDQLVTQHGVVFMGALSVLMLVVTGGNVKVLVVLYSVNVFIDFSLCLLGMSLHWWKRRAVTEKWVSKLMVSGVGFVLTSTVLIFNLKVKFFHGAWMTILLTGLLIFVCVRVKRHYLQVQEHLKGLDSSLADLPPELLHPPKSATTLKGPAIMLVGRYGGLGVHSLLTVLRLYPDLHDRYVFVSVGEIDSSRFKGSDEVAALEKSTIGQLEKYVRLAKNLGLEASMRHDLSVDPIASLEKLCLEEGKGNPKAVAYAGQLVFQQEQALTRFLHNQAAYSLQRRLVFKGLQMMILPIRLWEPKKAPSGTKKKKR